MTNNAAKYIRIFLALGCAFFFHTLLSAQRHRLKFDYLTLEHGLSQNSVYAICQDSKGFMWFGTEDGLNRYDGYNITVFRPVPGDPHSLKGSVVYTIREGRDGVLWIGTNSGGLNKFHRDTGTFSHYLHDPENPDTLSHDSVGVILVSRKQPGVLWLGTVEGGLNRFDSRTERFTRYRFDPSDPHSLAHDTVNALYEDRNGNIWIGANGGGLLKYDEQKDRFIGYPDDNGRYDQPVFAICEGPEGTLWVGGDGGLHRFDPSAGKCVPFHRRAGREGTLSNPVVRTLRTDSRGALWIGTLGGGLNRYDHTSGRFFHYLADSLDTNRLSDNDIWSLYEDRGGVLWIGSEGGGLNKLDLNRKPFIHYHGTPNAPRGLSHNDIWAIYESRREPGTVWLGAKGGGLIKLDRETETCKTYRHVPTDPHSLNNDTVFAICEDDDGRLWLGADGGGLNMFDPEKETFTHYTNDPDNPGSIGGNHVWTVCLGPDGGIWAGTDGGGLNRFDVHTKTFTRFVPREGDNRSISSYNIWSLHVDRDSILWVGTDNGLNRRHGETGTFTRYRKNGRRGGLNNNRVMCMYTDNRGILWIGTQGGGLNRLDPRTETFNHYLEDDGLANNSIYGILAEEHSPTGGTHHNGHAPAPNLWLSTNKGLSHFNPGAGVFRNYNKSDGLQADEFNAGACWRNPRGEMYFGGINGFNIFRPSEIKENPYIPPVAITGFLLFNRDVLPGKAVAGRVILEKAVTEVDKIKLHYHEDVFSIEFAALHYASPEENRFAYRMEGLEMGWNDVGGRRFVTYSHLPPGDYLFRVKASNCDGVWNETGASLAISIVPPPWKIWWVKVLLVLLAMTLLFLAYWWRVRRIHAHEHKLERLVDQRTRELKTKTIELEKLDHQRNQFLAELTEANKKLEKMSRIDGLTEIPNRRFFDEILEVEWKRCHRRQTPISLLMLDVDHFKFYNDTYGHLQGDECLKWIAAAIAFNISRTGDLAARYGGEEFGAVMVEAGLDGARAKAEDIRRAVQGLEIPHEKSDICDVVTISVGVATLVPDDENGSHKLIELADKALYKAKHNGRNQVCVKGE